jgi:hypothetical protein
MEDASLAHACYYNNESSTPWLRELGVPYHSSLHLEVPKHRVRVHSNLRNTQGDPPSLGLALPDMMRLSDSTYTRREILRFNHD